MSRTLVKWLPVAEIVAVKETGELVVYPYRNPDMPYDQYTMKQVGWIKISALECTLIYGVS